GSHGADREPQHVGVDLGSGGRGGQQAAQSEEGGCRKTTHDDLLMRSTAISRLQSDRDAGRTGGCTDAWTVLHASDSRTATGFLLWPTERVTEGATRRGCREEAPTTEERRQACYSRLRRELGPSLNR